VSHNVPSVLRLCQRVILLEHGTIAADGPPQTVTGRYLLSGSGSSAERVWPDAQMAPGDGVARMRAVRVRNEAGEVVEVVDAGDPVWVEMEYWARDWSERTTATLRFFNEDGVCLFAGAAFGAARDGKTMAGGSVIRARCRIPSHVFAEGRVFVLAAVITYGYPSTVHAIERDAVSFQVIDQRGDDGVREYYGGHWEGVMRPKLSWEVEP
jgi:lipopolysaccharide transport system ATP-binding protein